jgi:hypothetical protein
MVRYSRKLRNNNKAPLISDQPKTSCTIISACANYYEVLIFRKIPQIDLEIQQAEFIALQLKCYAKITTKRVQFVSQAWKLPGAGIQRNAYSGFGGWARRQIKLF